MPIKMNKTACKLEKKAIKKCLRNVNLTLNVISSHTETETE